MNQRVMRPARQKRGKGLPQSSFEGFTLVEVLVALAITGMLVSVLVSSLYYMFRVQESLRHEIVEREAELRRKAWFMDALAGCLPVEEKEGRPFTGTENEIQCETSAAITPRQSGVPMKITLQLQKEGGGQIKLNYREKEGKPHLLAQWAASEAAFRYIDGKGRALTRWPKEKRDQEALPGLIQLRVKMPEARMLVWLAAPRNTAWLEPPESNPLGLDLTK